MKRIVALLLSILLILGISPVDVISAESAPQKNYAGMGSYTVNLEADPVTITPPTDFGTAAANGKVWTDKSVTVHQDHFEVTLSALSQEYISESEENTTSSVAADVVMILDLSASMQNNTLTLNNMSMTRTKAMVKAVNEALDIIMRANQNNRVLIYTYQSNSNGSSPVVNELLPLGHYTNTSWNSQDVFSGNNGKYFNYTTSGTAGVIRSAGGLQRNGAAFAQKSLSTEYGTCTQHGILKGVQALTNAIAQENKTVDRKPYVLLFTDGAPGNATRSWYNSAANGCSFSHFNNSTAEITALSVLSAAYMKNTLNTAYRTYNGKDMGIEWFNIGLGVSSSELGSLFLQPWTIASGTSNTAQSVQSEIEDYTSGQYAAYADYATSYTYTVDAFFADSGDDLEGAFTELASRIEEETKVITCPIIAVGEGNSDLIFTDALGAGMSASNLYLHPNGDTAIFGIANGNTYSFNGYDTTVTFTTDAEGRTVLTWNLPAEEVAIFAFADRDNPTNGMYTAAVPTRLTYDVSVTDPDAYSGDTLYSNASAKAEFSIPGDNTYYFENDGTLKSAPFATQIKGQNITGLTNDAVSYMTRQNQNNTFITARLGNNGKLSPVVLLDKSAEDLNVLAGTEVIFTLAVTNKGQNNLSNVVLTDTLPNGLTYKAGSEENAAVSVENSILTFTIPSIDAGQTVTVTYVVVLPDHAVDGESFTNIASITRIQEVEVFSPAESSSTVTAYRTYRVVYEWDGDIPPGQLIPMDNGRYATGAAYPVDSNYTSETKIEKKDRFGNVTQRWTFSGWTDPNQGIMGEADVTVRGVWRYESFTYDAHRVIYTWTGEIPPDKTLPTDGNTYIKNEPYSVDSIYTAATEILTYDAHGNVNGRYTFSGWSDPNHGVMGDADITIPGVWQYESVDVIKHKVYYTWSGEIPPDAVMPTDSNAYAKNQTYGVDTTFTAETEVLTYDAHGNVNGRYTFSGWSDPNHGVMGDADITIPGVWQYESVDVIKHKVYYTWSGEIPPDAVMPTDSNAYAKNQIYGVDTTFTAETEVLTYDAHGNVNGRYTFSGWSDPNHGVMGDADITIPGVWQYESVDVIKHKVYYTWSGEIPPDAVIPTDSNAYAKNQTYTVDTTFTSTTEVLTYDAYGNVNGRYTFSGWSDPNHGVMGDEDVTIPGVWQYESVDVIKHKVYYTWSGEIPPDAVMPTDSNAYAKNQTYGVDTTFTAETEVLTYDAHGNVNGRYTFSGWSDPNHGVMGDADITIPGVWQYESVDVIKHKVYYTWSGEIPPDAVIPTDSNAYAKNQTYGVDTTFTAETEVLTYDAYGNVNGRYTFSGWSDPNHGVMGDADITIPGVWEFEAIAAPPAQDNPQTGEMIPMFLLAALMVMSATELILLDVLRRRMKV